MEERDYLMRQFNRFARAIGKLLAEILNLKDKGDTAETIEHVRQQLTTALNIDIEDIIAIPADDFIKKFMDDFDADFYGLEDLANMLYQVAHLFEDRDDMQMASPLFHRALIVYRYLSDTGNTFSIETHLRMGELQNYHGS